MPNEIKNVNPDSLTDSVSDKNKKPSLSSSSTATVTLWTVSGVVLAACTSGAGTKFIATGDGGGFSGNAAGGRVFVQKGSVKGAAVIFDFNGDGVGDMNDERNFLADGRTPRFVTNDDGEVEVPRAFESVPFQALLDGATDTTTGQALAGSLRSFLGSGVASPLTSLLLEAGATNRASAQAILDGIFGLRDPNDPESGSLITIDDVLDPSNYRLQPTDVLRPNPLSASATEAQIADYERQLEQYIAQQIETASIAIQAAREDATRLDNGGFSASTATAAQIHDQLVQQLTAFFDTDTNTNPSADLSTAITDTSTAARDIIEGKVVAAPNPYVVVDEDSNSNVFSIQGFVDDHIADFQANRQSGEPARSERDLAQEALTDLFGFADPYGNTATQVASSFRGVAINPTLTFSSGGHTGTLQFGGSDLSADQAITGDVAPTLTGAVANFHYVSYANLGQLSLDLPTNFHGTITFDYVVYDGATVSETATFTLTVAPVNDPPILGGIDGNRGTQSDPQYVVSSVTGRIVSENNVAEGVLQMVSDVEDTITHENVRFGGTHGHLFEAITTASGEIAIRLQPSAARLGAGETYDITVHIEDSEGGTSDTLTLSLTQGGLYVQPTGGTRVYSNGEALINEEADGSSTPVELGTVGLEGLTLGGTSAALDTVARSEVRLDAQSQANGFEISGTTLRYTGSDSGDFDGGTPDSHTITIEVVTVQNEEQLNGFTGRTNIDASGSGDGDDRVFDLEGGLVILDPNNPPTLINTANPGAERSEVTVIVQAGTIHVPGDGVNTPYKTIDFPETSITYSQEGRIYVDGGGQVLFNTQQSGVLISGEHYVLASVEDPSETVSSPAITVDSFSIGQLTFLASTASSTLTQDAGPIDPENVGVTFVYDPSQNEMIKFDNTPGGIGANRGTHTGIQITVNADYESLTYQQIMTAYQTYATVTYGGPSGHQVMFRTPTLADGVSPSAVIGPDLVGTDFAPPGTPAPAMFHVGEAGSGIRTTTNQEGDDVNLRFTIDGNQQDDFDITFDSASNTYNFVFKGENVEVNLLQVQTELAGISGAGIEVYGTDLENRKISIASSGTTPAVEQDPADTSGTQAMFAIGGDDTHGIRTTNEVTGENIELEFLFDTNQNENVKFVASAPDPTTGVTTYTFTVGRVGSATLDEINTAINEYNAVSTNTGVPVMIQTFGPDQANRAIEVETGTNNNGVDQTPLSSGTPAMFAVGDDSHGIRATELGTGDQVSIEFKVLETQSEVVTIAPSVIGGVNKYTFTFSSPRGATLQEIQDYITADPNGNLANAVIEIFGTDLGSRRISVPEGADAVSNPDQESGAEVGRPAFVAFGSDGLGGIKTVDNVDGSLINLVFREQGSTDPNADFLSVTPSTDPTTGITTYTFTVASVNDRTTVADLQTYLDNNLPNALIETYGVETNFFIVSGGQNIQHNPGGGSNNPNVAVFPIDDPEGIINLGVADGTTRPGVTPGVNAEGVGGTQASFYAGAAGNGIQAIGIGTGEDIQLRFEFNSGSGNFADVDVDTSTPGVTTYIIMTSLGNGATLQQVQTALDTYVTNNPSHTMLIQTYGSDRATVRIDVDNTEAAGSVDHSSNRVTIGDDTEFLLNSNTEGVTAGHLPSVGVDVSAGGAFTLDTDNIDGLTDGEGPQGVGGVQAVFAFNNVGQAGLRVKEVGMADKVRLKFEIGTLNVEESQPDPTTGVITYTITLPLGTSVTGGQIDGEIENDWLIEHFGGSTADIQIFASGGSVPDGVSSGGGSPRVTADTEFGFNDQNIEFLTPESLLKSGAAIDSGTKFKLNDDGTGGTDGVTRGSDATNGEVTIADGTTFALDDDDPTTGTPGVTAGEPNPGPVTVTTPADVTPAVTAVAHPAAQPNINTVAGNPATPRVYQNEYTETHTYVINLRNIDDNGPVFSSPDPSAVAKASISFDVPSPTPSQAVWNIGPDDDHGIRTTANAFGNEIRFLFDIDANAGEAFDIDESAPDSDGVITVTFTVDAETALTLEQIQTELDAENIDLIEVFGENLGERAIHVDAATLNPTIDADPGTAAMFFFGDESHGLRTVDSVTGAGIELEFVRGASSQTVPVTIVAGAADAQGVRTITITTIDSDQGITLADITAYLEDPANSDVAALIQTFGPDQANRKLVVDSGTSGDVDHVSATDVSGSPASFFFAQAGQGIRAKTLGNDHNIELNFVNAGTSAPNLVITENLNPHTGITTYTFANNGNVVSLSDIQTYLQANLPSALIEVYGDDLTPGFSTSTSSSGISQFTGPLPGGLTINGATPDANGRGVTFTLSDTSVNGIDSGDIYPDSLTEGSSASFFVGDATHGIRTATSQEGDAIEIEFVHNPSASFDLIINENIQGTAPSQTYKYTITIKDGTATLKEIDDYLKDSNNNLLAAQIEVFGTDLENRHIQASSSVNGVLQLDAADVAAGSGIGGTQATFHTGEAGHGIRTVIGETGENIRLTFEHDAGLGSQEFDIRETESGGVTTYTFVYNRLDNEFTLEEIQDFLDANLPNALIETYGRDGQGWRILIDDSAVNTFAHEPNGVAVTIGAGTSFLLNQGSGSATPIEGVTAGTAGTLIGAVVEQGSGNGFNLNDDSVDGVTPGADVIGVGATKASFSFGTGANGIQTVIGETGENIRLVFKSGATAIEETEVNGITTYTITVVDNAGAGSDIGTLKALLPAHAKIEFYGADATRIVVDDNEAQGYFEHVAAGVTIGDDTSFTLNQDGTDGTTAIEGVTSGTYGSLGVTIDTTTKFKLDSSTEGVTAGEEPTIAGIEVNDGRGFTFSDTATGLDLTPGIAGELPRQGTFHVGSEGAGIRTKEAIHGDDFSITWTAVSGQTEPLAVAQSFVARELVYTISVPETDRTFTLQELQTFLASQDVPFEVYGTDLASRTITVSTDAADTITQAEAVEGSQSTFFIGSAGAGIRTIENMDGSGILLTFTTNPNVQDAVEVRDNLTDPNLGYDIHFRGTGGTFTLQDVAEAFARRAATDPDFELEVYGTDLASRSIIITGTPGNTLTQDAGANTVTLNHGTNFNFGSGNAGLTNGVDPTPNMVTIGSGTSFDFDDTIDGLTTSVAEPRPGVFWVGSDDQGIRTTTDRLGDDIQLQFRVSGSQGVDLTIVRGQPNNQGVVTYTFTSKTDQGFSLAEAARVLAETVPDSQIEIFGTDLANHYIRMDSATGVNQNPPIDPNVQGSPPNPDEVEVPVNSQFTFNANADPAIAIPGLFAGAAPRGAATFSVGQDNGLTFTAKDVGAQGNDIQVVFRAADLTSGQPATATGATASYSTANNQKILTLTIGVGGATYQQIKDAVEADTGAGGADEAIEVTIADGQGTYIARPSGNGDGTNLVGGTRPSATHGENVGQGVVLFTVLAEDADNDAITYSLDADSALLFDINKNAQTGAGEITLKSTTAFNFEAVTSYNIEVIATSTFTGAQPKTATVPITIFVTNVNEAPENLDLTAANPVVNAPAGAVPAGGILVSTVTASDQDVGDTLTYSVGGTHGHLFSVIENQAGQQELRYTGTAASFLAQGDDYEITITVRDSGGATDTITETITHGGLFVMPTTAGNAAARHESYVGEEIYSGGEGILPEAIGAVNLYSTVGTFNINGDSSTTGSGIFLGVLGDQSGSETYRLESGGSAAAFRVGTDSSDVWGLYYFSDSSVNNGGSGDFDQQTPDSHTLTIVGIDANNNEISYEYVVNLFNVDDNRPEFANDQATLDANLGDSSFTATSPADPANDPVLISGVDEGYDGVIFTAQAADADIGDPDVVYLLGAGTADNDLFTIDSTTGEVTFKTGTSNFEHASATNGLFNIRVTATTTSPLTITSSGATSIPARTASQNYNIQLNDVNEAPTGVSVSRAALVPGSDVVGILNAIDEDASGTYTFALTGSGNDNTLFAIVNDNELHFSGTTQQRKGTGETYTVEITVTEGSNTAPTVLTIVEGTLTTTHSSGGGARFSNFVDVDGNGVLDENENGQTAAGRTEIGTLNSVLDSSATFSLVAASADNNNGDFQIDGGRLYYIGNDAGNFEDGDTLTAEIEYSFGAVPAVTFPASQVRNVNAPGAGNTQAIATSSTLFGANGFVTTDVTIWVQRGGNWREITDTITNADNGNTLANIGSNTYVVWISDGNLVAVQQSSSLGNLNTPSGGDITALFAVQQVSGTPQFVNVGSLITTTVRTGGNVEVVPAVAGTTATETYTIRLSDVNEAPTLTATSTNPTVAQGGSHVLTVTDLAVTDPDAADMLNGQLIGDEFIFTVSGASNGAVQIAGADVTTFNLEQLRNGEVSFVHDGSGQSGQTMTIDDGRVVVDPSGTSTTAVSFTVADGDGLTSASGGITFDVTFTDAAPLEADSSRAGSGTPAVAFSLAEDGTANITGEHLAFDDPDSDADEIFFIVRTLPGNGALWNTADSANPVQLAVGSTFTLDDLVNDRIEYRHDGDESNTDTFTYSVYSQDSSGTGPQAFATNSADNSQTFTLNIALTDVNDAPTLRVDGTGNRMDEHLNDRYDTGFFFTPADDDNDVSGFTDASFTVYTTETGPTTHTALDVVFENGAYRLIKLQNQQLDFETGSGGTVSAWVGVSDGTALSERVKVDIPLNDVVEPLFLGFGGQDFRQNLGDVEIDENSGGGTKPNRIGGSAPEFRIQDALGNSGNLIAAQPLSAYTVYEGNTDTVSTLFEVVRTSDDPNDAGYLVRQISVIDGQTIDFETTPTIHITIAVVHPTLGTSQRATMNIRVNNEYDSGPVITSPATVSFAETAVDDTTTIYTAEGTPDEGASQISWSLVGSDDDDLFEIVSGNQVRFKDDPGLVSTGDRTFTFTIQGRTTLAGTSTGDPRTTDREVTLTLTDVQTAATIDFDVAGGTQGSLTASVNENAAPGTGLSLGGGVAGGVRVFFVDESGGPTADIDETDFKVYNTGTTTDSTLFQIVKSSNEFFVQVRAGATLDHETAQSHVVDIVSTAGGLNSNTLTLTVNLNDVADVAPSITSSRTAPDGEEGVVIAGTTIYTAEATPDVAGASIAWDIGTGHQSDLFQIDPSSGEVSFKVRPSITQDTEYRFVVEATNGGETATQEVSFTLTNVAGIRPTIDFSGGAASGSLFVTDGGHTFTTTSQISVLAYDSSVGTGSGAGLTSVVLSDARYVNDDGTVGGPVNGFSYSGGTQGSEGTVTYTRPGTEVFDYDPVNNDNIRLSFTATAATGETRTSHYLIDVRPANDAGITFENQPTTASVDEGTAPFNDIVTITATRGDRDPAGSIRYTFDGTPQHSTQDTLTGWNIDATTGVISYTGLDALQPGTVTFVVVASDDAGQSERYTGFTLTVNDVNTPPMFTVGGSSASGSFNEGMITSDVQLSTLLVIDDDDNSAVPSYTVASGNVFITDADTDADLTSLFDFRAAAGRDFGVYVKSGNSFNFEDPNQQKTYRLKITVVDDVAKALTDPAERAMGTAEIIYTVTLSNVDEGDAEFSLTGDGTLGTPEVGDVLTIAQTKADPDGFADNPAYEYHWFAFDAPLADGTAIDFSVHGSAQITGATTSSYTVTSAEAGKYIYARISYDDASVADKERILVSLNDASGDPVAIFVPLLSLPSETVTGTASGETLAAHASAAALYQGGALEDTITVGNFNGNVVVGGYGDDTINLGSGDGNVDTVVYRFEKTATGRLTTTDGGDTINNFELGVDKLIFADVAGSAPLTSFADFIDFVAASSVIKVRQIEDANVDFAGLEILLPDAGTQDGTSTGAAAGALITINFKNSMTVTWEADELDYGDSIGGTFLEPGLDRLVSEFFTDTFIVVDDDDLGANGLTIL